MLHYGGEVTPHYGRGLVESLVGPGLARLGAVIVAPDARDGQDWTAPGNKQAAVWLTRCVAENSVIPKNIVALDTLLQALKPLCEAGRLDSTLTWKTSELEPLV